MKLVVLAGLAGLAVLAFLAACVLSACGQTSDTDPFVGTWRLVETDDPVSGMRRLDAAAQVRHVISKDGDRYMLAIGVPGSLEYGVRGPFTREGDTLSHTERYEDTGEWDTMELSVGETPDELGFALDASWGATDEPLTGTLERVSDSTATPTPVP